jgi:serine/threonine protein kinase
LAARNCLVNIDQDKNSITVKIADFGLARELDTMYYYKQKHSQKPLPIRWMAPESLDYVTFTTKSDIWYLLGFVRRRIHLFRGL